MSADTAAERRDRRCKEQTMSDVEDGTRASGVTQDRSPIERLLFVADAAVADVDELPQHVRSVIDAAADIFVLTPTLPGRLAWLADDVDGFRHMADERLDAVLGHLRSAPITRTGRSTI
jgi:hypothetical protein